MVNILFAFGVIGMIMGSVAAIKERNIRRMTAYSSVAQIGYIYMGLGLGTTAGVVAAVFHIISHGVMKSLLFLSISGLTEVSDGRSDYLSLRGAGLRNKIAGVAFYSGFTFYDRYAAADRIYLQIFICICGDNSRQ